MSSFPTRSATGAGRSKLQNINSLYSGKNPSSGVKPLGRNGGLTSVGKVQNVVRRMPPPVNLQSLRAESQGQDPDVALVPQGGTGWNKADAETPPPSSTHTTTHTATAAHATPSPFDSNKAPQSSSNVGSGTDMRPIWAKPQAPPENQSCVQVATRDFPTLAASAAQPVNKDTLKKAWRSSGSTCEDSELPARFYDGGSATARPYISTSFRGSSDARSLQAGGYGTAALHSTPVPSAHRDVASYRETNPSAAPPLMSVETHAPERRDTLRETNIDKSRSKRAQNGGEENFTRNDAMKSEEEPRKPQPEYRLLKREKSGEEKNGTASTLTRATLADLSRAVEEDEEELQMTKLSKPKTKVMKRGAPGQKMTVMQPHKEEKKEEGEDAALREGEGRDAALTKEGPVGSSPPSTPAAIASVENVWEKRKEERASAERDKSERGGRGLQDSLQHHFPSVAEAATMRVDKESTRKSSEAEFVKVALRARRAPVVNDVRALQDEGEDMVARPVRPPALLHRTDKAERQERFFARDREEGEYMDRRERGDYDYGRDRVYDDAHAREQRGGGGGDYGRGGGRGYNRERGGETRDGREHREYEGGRDRERELDGGEEAAEYNRGVRRDYYGGGNRSSQRGARGGGGGMAIGGQRGYGRQMGGQRYERRDNNRDYEDNRKKDGEESYGREEEGKREKRWSVDEGRREVRREDRENKEEHREANRNTHSPLQEEEWRSGKTVSGPPPSAPRGGRGRGGGQRGERRGGTRRGDDRGNGEKRGECTDVRLEKERTDRPAYRKHTAHNENTEREGTESGEGAHNERRPPAQRPARTLYAPKAARNKNDGVSSGEGGGGVEREKGTDGRLKSPVVSSEGHDEWETASESSQKNNNSSRRNVRNENGAHSNVAVKGEGEVEPVEGSADFEEVLSKKAKKARMEEEKARRDAEEKKRVKEKEREERVEKKRKERMDSKEKHLTHKKELEKKRGDKRKDVDPHKFEEVEEESGVKNVSVSGGGSTPALSASAVPSAASPPLTKMMTVTTVWNSTQPEARAALEAHHGHAHDAPSTHSTPTPFNGILPSPIARPKSGKKASPVELPPSNTSSDCRPDKYEFMYDESAPTPSSTASTAISATITRREDCTSIGKHTQIVRKTGGAAASESGSANSTDDQQKLKENLSLCKNLWAAGGKEETLAQPPSNVAKVRPQPQSSVSGEEGVRGEGTEGCLKGVSMDGVSMGGAASPTVSSLSGVSGAAVMGGGGMSSAAHSLTHTSPPHNNSALSAPRSPASISSYNTMGGFSGFSNYVLLPSDLSAGNGIFSSSNAPTVSPPNMAMSVYGGSMGVGGSAPSSRNVMGSGGQPLISTQSLSNIQHRQHHNSSAPFNDMSSQPLHMMQHSQQSLHRSGGNSSFGGWPMSQLDSSFSSSSGAPLHSQMGGQPLSSSGSRGGVSGYGGGGGGMYGGGTGHSAAPAPPGPPHSSPFIPSSQQTMKRTNPTLMPPLFPTPDMMNMPPPAVGAVGGERGQTLASSGPHGAHGGVQGGVQRGMGYSSHSQHSNYSATNPSFIMQQQQSSLLHPLPSHSPSSIPSAGNNGGSYGNQSSGAYGGRGGGGMDTWKGPSSHSQQQPQLMRQQPQHSASYGNLHSSYGGGAGVSRGTLMGGASDMWKMQQQHSMHSAHHPHHAPHNMNGGGGQSSTRHEANNSNMWTPSNL